MITLILVMAVGHEIAGNGSVKKVKRGICIKFAGLLYSQPIFETLVRKALTTRTEKV
jgi:hypothetical protein